MNNEESDDTTDEDPQALVLQNDGNAYLNISINFTSLWTSITMPNETFKFKVRNVSDACFVNQTSTTFWTNVPLTTNAIIDSLNFTGDYQTGCNNASIDLYVEVPVNEEPGNRSSLITFTSSLGEVYGAI